ncbi:MAG: VCBS repeat-containing protein [Minicystis sp.]
MAGIAGVFATVLAGTNCAGAPCETTGTAVERTAVNDWVIFNMADANADGMFDLFWFSRSANQLEVWLMNGAHVLAPGHPIPGPPGTGWEPVVAVDFNGDGLADVVWTNAERGTMTVYLMNGVDLLAPGPEIQGPPGAGWAVGAAGDTNGDGLADVAWYNRAERRFSVWLMNGVHVLAPGPVLLGPQHQPHLLVDLGDTNLDGMTDSIWDDRKTHTLEVWLLSGAHVLTYGPHLPAPPGEGWMAIAIADFNRDGLEDVVWMNADRRTMLVWLLNGARLLAGGPEIEGPGAGWTLDVANDTNGDGMADVVWRRDGTSVFSVWLMDGAHVLARGPEIPGPSADDAAAIRR